MRPKLNLAANIPERLKDADERLTLYGRWAMARRKTEVCGSAERSYRPEKGEALEARREAREMLMLDAEALLCQRALARVPDVYRIVLTVLYVPKHIGLRPIPVEAQMRVLRIPPRISQERHISGLTMFDNQIKVLYAART